MAYDDHSYYASSSSDDTALGMLLGGVVGGIIGAEIDGGHNKTAGAVVGAIVGAAIGASVANADNDVVHYPKTGVVYDAEGRHAYENEAYLPPREIKTCLRYETRNKEHICTKWTVEYVYDDDD
ncbi:MAG: glycine zipper 2TM domain-containing protein [Kordiimonadaceae bacterium]|nr:glycine zipper 2TM domain-containing protein [Kordiimonadaceae bacterium]